MNYDNYERAIVEAYGVELKNFPGGKVQQPGSLPLPKLQALVSALEDTNPYTACQWALLSEAALRSRIARNHERQEQGEQVYVARKKKQDARSTFKSREEVDSSSSDSE